MMPRSLSHCLTPLLVLAACSLVGSRALAFGTVTVSYVMPQGVDPNPYFFTANGQTLLIPGSDLLPANLGGADGADLFVVTPGLTLGALRLASTYDGPITITPSVAAGFAFAPWTVTPPTVMPRGVGLLTAAPGSALLGELADGSPTSPRYFARLSVADIGPDDVSAFASSTVRVQGFVGPGAVVPEPGVAGLAVGLLGAGLLCVLGRRARR